MKKSLATIILAFIMAFTMMPVISDDCQVHAATDGCSANYTWSGWSTTAPPSGSESQSRTEYRYKDKKVIQALSQPSTPSGYTYSSSANSGTYTSWGSWSDYSTTARSNTTLQNVETTTGYRYYAFRCANCGTRDPYSGSCSNCGGTNMVWVVEWGTCTGQNYGNGYTKIDNNKGRIYWKDAYWYFEFPGTSDGQGGTGQPTTTLYRYRTRQEYKNYTYWRTNYTSWATTTPPSDSQYQTRTTYRYKTLGPHTLDAGKVTRAPKYFTAGIKTHTCQACGETVNTSLGTLSLAPVTPARTKITSAKVAKKKLTIKWKRVAAKTVGDQIAIKDKKTGQEKYYTVKQSSKKTLSKKIGKLKKKRIYAVRLRPYNIVEGRAVYGAWSNVKSGKVK